jgi:uncharacterized membrane protein (DUF4010 family)
MERYEPFISLGLALVAGLLIGFEREQSQSSSRDTEPFLGGVRTYPLFALVGSVSMLLSRQLGAVVVFLALAAMTTFLAIAYVDDVRRGVSRGLTSEAAFLLTFLLGVLATVESTILPVSRKAFVVISAAVVATLLLSLKPRLHTVSRRVSSEDVLATMKFLLVAVVVLPLLPNRTFGPLDVLNPFEIGLMVALIAGISFSGYVAIRLLGPRRGLGVTGIVGGLASSTAVTLTFSGKARELPALRISCALAVVLASSIMFPRVLVEIAIANANLLPRVSPPIAAMGIAGLIASWRLGRRSSRLETAPDVDLKNPFELSSAIKIALLYAVVLFGAKAATVYFGSKGTYAAGVLGGLTDVDAITLSMASLAKTSLSDQVAATTIYLGTVANTMVKAAIATAIGGWEFGRLVLVAFSAVLVAGLVGLAAIWAM